MNKFRPTVVNNHCEGNCYFCNELLLFAWGDDVHQIVEEDHLGIDVTVAIACGLCGENHEASQDVVIVLKPIVYDMR